MSPYSHPGGSGERASGIILTHPLKWSCQSMVSLTWSVLCFQHSELMPSGSDAPALRFNWYENPNGLGTEL